MTVNASGSRHSLALIPEVSYAVTPATPVFAAVRHNGTTLQLSKSSLQSGELRPDRQIAGFRSGTRTAAGDITSEVTAGGSFDTLLSLALMGVWTSDVLKTGLLRNTVTMERFFEDVVQYERFRGCEVNKLALSVKSGAIASAVFSIMANDADPMAQVIITGATYTAAPTGQPMTGLEAAVMEGGSALALISDISLSVDNALASTFVVGQANSLLPSVGKSNVTGTATMYFADATLYNKFVNETDSSLQFTLSDTAGNSYAILLPKIRYTGAPLPVTSEGPITMAMPFQGLLDTTTGTNIQITRTIAP